MHASSMKLMENFVNRYLDKTKTLKILDVGSCDINGSYKQFFNNKNWNYKGLDISKGKNVNIVVKNIYDWHDVINDNEYDIVISGQCLEHVEEPWSTAKEIYRVCNINGFCCIITPWNVGCHRFPIDCYRYLPDGMRYLFTKIGKFIELDCNYGGSNSMDCWFYGTKI